MDCDTGNADEAQGSNATSDLDGECRVALEAARAAGRYLRDSADDVEIRTFKEGTFNYATVQDIEAEKIIVETIRAHFPNDAVLAEESFPNAESADRLWVIDPLDGMRNYANHLPFFSVSIAFCRRNVPHVGVVYAPCLNDELFCAVRGRGASLNDRPLRMARPAVDLTASIVTTGFSYRRGAALRNEMLWYERALNQATDVIRNGSAALDLCYVAAGRLGAYYEAGLKPWDAAAGILILAEAGGMVTDYAGDPLDILHKNDSSFAVDLLASKNEVIAQAMLSILRS